jgi:hypothetical protein
MTPVQRLEIIIAGPHASRVTRFLESHGLTGWTRVAGVTGAGERGLQLDDELTGVSSNQLIVAAAPPEDVAPILTELHALLRHCGGVCLVSEAHWL